MIWRRKKDFFLQPSSGLMAIHFYPTRKIPCAAKFEIPWYNRLQAHRKISLSVKTFFLKPINLQLLPIIISFLIHFRKSFCKIQITPLHFMRLPIRWETQNIILHFRKEGRLPFKIIFLQKELHAAEFMSLPAAKNFRLKKKKPDFFT